MIYIRHWIYFKIYTQSNLFFFFFPRHDIGNENGVIRKQSKIFLSFIGSKKWYCRVFSIVVASSKRAFKDLEIFLMLQKINESNNNKKISGIPFS